MLRSRCGTSDNQVVVAGKSGAEEDLLADELEVATYRDAVIGHIDLPDVDAIPQHVVKRLRGHGPATPCFQTECDDDLSDFMLRESSGGEALETRAERAARALGRGSCSCPSHALAVSGYAARALAPSVSFHC